MGYSTTVLEYIVFMTTERILITNILIWQFVIYKGKYVQMYIQKFETDFIPVTSNEEVFYFQCQINFITRYNFN